MKVHIITIVLDGMPWLPAIYTSLQQSKRVDWMWHVSHGTAKATKCTSWCKNIRPRLSNDGTTEFLKFVAGNPRVKVYENKQWDGKIEMVNAGMCYVEEGDCVVQMDSDELWNPYQLEVMVNIWKCHADYNQMDFWCRYFVGPNRVLEGDGYGNRKSEWVRAWKAHKGFAFERHEPPKINAETKTIGRDQTREWGLVFDHYAYATEKQVEFKEKYYGYEGAVEQWKQLQKQTDHSVKANDFLKWIDGDNIKAVKLHE